MSVPALAQMGKYTGNHRYFDDAVRQVLQFSDRMFNEDKDLFMHGWIQGTDEHPQFHWGRANGWAVMAMVELLDVLPEDHAGREEVLELLRRQVGGLARYQSPLGFWHVTGSPDGRFLAGDNFSREIYLIDRNTQEIILLSAGYKRRAADHPHPTFSPDGTRIQIQSAMLSEDGRSMNICIIPVPEERLQRNRETPEGE